MLKIQPLILERTDHMTLNLTHKILFDNCLIEVTTGGVIME